MFGLNKHDLKNIQQKLHNQNSYLESNYFTTSSGQVKTLKDVSFSANHSVRYYAQLSNKIDTMTKTALSQGLHSCFLTMTLDGFYRDLLQGDYTRWDSLSDEEIKVAIQSVPNTEVLGEVRQKIERREILTIKDLYNILNHQTKRYLQSYAFKKLKKLNHKYMYIRTVEPHKDGVPHFHMMLYIPGEHVEQFKKDFIKSYPAPRNRAIKDSNKYIQNYIIDNQELESFQTDIRDTTAYIMKYILKSFMDVKNQKEIDYIQAWYIKHRIMRCVTSRALVPQWVYQKAFAFEKDWFHLTDILNDPFNHCEWNREDNYFYFIDNYTNRELIYSYGVYQVVYEHRIIKEIGVVKEKSIKVQLYDKIPSTWTKKEASAIPIIQDDRLIGHFKNSKSILFKDSISPGVMTDYELYAYYLKLDIETCNLQHYGYVKNCMIDRGMLNEEKQIIDNFNDTFNDIPDLDFLSSPVCYRIKLSN